MSNTRSDRQRQDDLDLALVEFAGKRQIDADWLSFFVLLLTVLGEPE